jgi:hypothetical protein
MKRRKNKPGLFGENQGAEWIRTRAAKDLRRIRREIYAERKEKEGRMTGLGRRI